MNTFPVSDDAPQLHQWRNEDVSDDPEEGWNTVCVRCGCFWDYEKPYEEQEREACPG